MRAEGSGDLDDSVEIVNDDGGEIIFKDDLASEVVGIAQGDERVLILIGYAEEYGLGSIENWFPEGGEGIRVKVSP